MFVHGGHTRTRTDSCQSVFSPFRHYGQRWRPFINDIYIFSQHDKHFPRNACTHFKHPLLPSWRKSFILYKQRSFWQRHACITEMHVYEWLEIHQYDCMERLLHHECLIITFICSVTKRAFSNAPDTIDLVAIVTQSGLHDKCLTCETSFCGVSFCWK